MIARLHRLVAFYTARGTYRRMGERHWYAGCGWPANDDDFLARPSGRGPTTAQRSVGPNIQNIPHT